MTVSLGHEAAEVVMVADQLHNGIGGGGVPGEFVDGDGEGEAVRRGVEGQRTAPGEQQEVGCEGLLITWVGFVSENITYDTIFNFLKISDHVIEFYGSYPCHHG